MRLFPGRVELGDDAGKMNRALPYGPKLSVREKCGARRQPTRERMMSAHAAGLLTACWAERGGGNAGPWGRGESWASATGPGRDQGWCFSLFFSFFFPFLKPFPKGILNAIKF